GVDLCCVALWKHTGRGAEQHAGTHSSTPRRICGSDVACTRGLVRRLSGRGARHLYVDGGKTMQAFLDAGLLQQLIITRMPMLIGSGIPLFGPLPKDMRFRHN